MSSHDRGDDSDSVLIDFFLTPTDPPVISLELGSKLQAGDIKEGDDVYFECKIDSNPKYRKLMWLQNVSLKYLNKTHIN